MKKYFVDYGNVEYMTISLDNARKIARKEQENNKGINPNIYSMVEVKDLTFDGSTKEFYELEEAPLENISSSSQESTEESFLADTRIENETTKANVDFEQLFLF